MDKVIWTKEEQHRFLSTVKSQDPTWHVVFSLALMTGLRAGELYALTWEDVNFDEKLIRVSKAYNHKIKAIKEHTKTKRNRFVPINEQLGALLRSLGPKEGSNFVLNRMPLFEHGEQSKAVAKWALRAGVPKVRFHDLRAFFASTLLVCGVPMVTVMQICGWSQLSTAQHYLRLSGKAVMGTTDGVHF